jgi:hypothetical protein
MKRDLICRFFSDRKKSLFRGFSAAKELVSTSFPIVLFRDFATVLESQIGVGMI